MNNFVFFPIGITFLGFALTLFFTSQEIKKWLSLLVAACFTGFGLWSLTSDLFIFPLNLQVGGWETPFGISLVYDHLAALMITVTGFVYFSVILYSKTGENAEDSNLFYPLIHVLICGISGAFITGDLFNLYVWFEVILLSSFVLLSMGTKPSQLAGAFKYVVLNIISSLVFLAAAGLIYNSTHTLHFGQLSQNLLALSETDPYFVLSLNVLIFTAFAIKSALFPFFFWLPASYHKASPAISALFAGLLTKVGLYAIFRVNLFTFPESVYMKAILTGVACLSILIGVMGAIVQTNIRRILGFHIVSQVGYIGLAGIFAFSSDDQIKVFGISCALFYMSHHILVKANLFLVSGLIRSLAGYENLSKLGGLVSKSSLVAFLFAVPALSLAGIPPLSGFWAKLGIFQVSLSSHFFLGAIVMLVGGFFTVFSMAKIWINGFWGEWPGEGNGIKRSVPIFSLLACIFLSGLTISIGINPDLLFFHTESAAQSLIGESDETHSID